MCFHLPHAAQRQRLRGVLREFGVALLSTPDDVTPDVFAWLAKCGDHEPDWADAWLAVMSARLPRAKVWTYDQEFRAIWRRPNGTRIPLAV